MMTDEGNEGDFASVIWDKEPSGYDSQAAGPLQQRHSGDAAAAGASGGASHGSTGDGGLARRASSSGANRTGSAGPDGAEGGSAAGPSSSSSDAQSQGRYAIRITVSEPVKMLEGTKDAYISYRVKGETDLPQYSAQTFDSRRRFQDFVFLHDHLMKDFSACVVPPLPSKQRLEYLKGDRFSPEFIQKRSGDLHRFVQRLSRHPTLARSQLLQDFCESTEWNIRMHQHLAHPPNSPETSTSGPGSIIDSLSDSLLNAFSKVRKPDERFLEVRESLDKFEESLIAIERTELRARTRIGDLASDYEDFGASIQGLGYLESGITEPLARFEKSVNDFSSSLRHTTFASTESFLAQLHSLIDYARAFRTVLKLRDQKQLDFEELSAYLSTLTNERDRLSNGQSAGLGLTSYFKDRVESFRGHDADITREGKIRKLDKKIAELQDAVGGAHDTSVAFDNEVLREHRVFQAAKRAEMKELMLSLVDAHVAHYQKSIEEMARCQPYLESIRVS